MTAVKKITKKEIKDTVEKAIGTALKKLSVSSPSKKTKRILAKAAKNVSRQLKAEVKDLKKRVKAVQGRNRQKP